MTREIIGWLDYTTQDGDTFDTLALDAYDDEFSANIVMKHNPDHIGTLVFDAGVALRIPLFDGSASTDSLPPWRKDETAV